MPTSPAFEKRYRGLNPAQREAVDAIDGPVMVVAGPGTGKTEILTLRIANILLKTDTQPENILALTFTESGAHAMRKRLVEIIGTRAYKLNLNTFHGFCNELIGNYPEHFPRVVGGLPITDADQLSLIEEILTEEGFPLLRPFGDPTHHVKGILSAIQALKRDAVSAAEFTAIVAEEEKQFSETPDRYHEKGAHKGKMKGEYKKLEERIAKNKELARAYESYQEKLFATHRYDYDDMIVEVVHSLGSDPDFLLMLQEEYQYILADEHQDTNNAQNKILELLSGFHERPNLFIVGDEKQAIFRFQGASLRNFIYFRDRFPDVKLISLTENYRSTQKILDSAHSLIGHAAGDPTLRKELRSQKGEGGHILNVLLPDATTEAAFIAEEAERLIASGTPADEIAVIYRNNNDADPLIRAFESKTSPFTLSSEQHLLSDADIVGLTALFRAVLAPGAEAAIAAVLYLPYCSLRALDAYRLTVYASLHRMPLSDLWENEVEMQKAGVSDPSLVRGLAHKIHQWASVAQSKSLLETLDTIIEESGYLPHLLSAKGSLDRIERLERFLDIAKRLVESHKRYQLADFIRYLDIIEKHGIMKTGSRTPAYGVRLMTAHRAKGLEFAHVFITGAYDGHWGGARGRTSFRTTLVDSPLSGEKGDDDDERRLFYVALTRAKERAVITRPQFGSDGRELHPTRFLEEIDPPLIEAFDPGEWLTRYRADHEARHKARRNFGPELTERAYLTERFLEQGLSVSALNNYLECPWKYFFHNLVRIPEAKEKFALYGTVVHDTLEDFFRKWKADGTDPGPDFLMERFHFFLNRVPLAEREWKELGEKGERALPGYYRAYHDKWNTNIQCEFKVKGIHLDIQHGAETVPLLLTGKLDKVEFEEGGRVNVVDYKTAQPKSRNVIEGKTKSSDGDYKRQLVFYKLLLDRYDEGKWKMETGEIDFIEPDKGGKYHKERFMVSAEDVAALAAEVRRVGEEILSFAFWDTTCKEEDCQYCALRKTMPDR